MFAVFEICSAMNDRCRHVYAVQNVEMPATRTLNIFRLVQILLLTWRRITKECRWERFWCPLCSLFCVCVCKTPRSMQTKILPTSVLFNLHIAAAGPMRIPVGKCYRVHKYLVIKNEFFGGLLGLNSLWWATTKRLFNSFTCHCK